MLVFALPHTVQVTVVRENDDDSSALPGDRASHTASRLFWFLHLITVNKL